MKESLAARQAALLKQNAELNERVEAIEQRRQQQLIGTSNGERSSPFHSATIAGEQHPATKNHGRQDRHGMLQNDDDDDDDEEDAFDKDLETKAALPSAAAGNRSQASLRMDLSASIDSFGSKSNDVEPQENDDESEEAKHAAAASSRSSDKPRQRSMKRQSSSGSKFERAEGDSSSPGGIAGSSRRINSGSGGGDAVANTADPHTPEGLGLEATVRYQKARLRVLQDEADSANAHVKELQASHGVLKSQVDDLRAENGLLAKKFQQTQQLVDKQKELSTAQEAKQRILESQLAAAQAKAEEIQRSEKQASQQFRSKDVRLNRALEELEKVKTQLQEEKKAHDKEMITKSEYEHVVVENKRLEKQKSELLVAFKKQMKLIDLLKRQRIHMEVRRAFDTKVLLWEEG